MKITNGSLRIFEVIQHKKALIHFWISAVESKNKSNVECTIDEVQALFLATQEIFNIFTNVFDQSTTDFPMNEHEAIEIVEILMRDLHLGFEEYKKIVHKRYFP